MKDKETTPKEWVQVGAMFFCREQFLVGLHLPIPSLVKKFFHYMGITSILLHPNVSRILMRYSVLNSLYNLELSILKTVFIYFIKVSLHERFLLFVATPSLQLVTSLLNLSKGWKKGSVLVSGPQMSLRDRFNQLFKLNYTMKTPSKCFMLFFLLTFSLLLYFPAFVYKEIELRPSR